MVGKAGFTLASADRIYGLTKKQREGTLHAQGVMSQLKMPDPDFWGLWLSVDSRHPDPPITVFQRDDPQQNGVKLLSPVSDFF